MCLICFASSVCFGADVKQVLTRTGLVERAIPAGDAWRLANRDLVDYVITDDAGQIAVTEQRNFRRPPSVNVPFHGKTLLGTNKGEWGGNLSVVDADGTAAVLVLFEAGAVSSRCQVQRDNCACTGHCHHMITRCSGGRYIGSPGLISNAS